MPADITRGGQLSRLYPMEQEIRRPCVSASAAMDTDPLTVCVDLDPR